MRLNSIRNSKAVIFPNLHKKAYEPVFVNSDTDDTKPMMEYKETVFINAQKKDKKYYTSTLKTISVKQVGFFIKNSFGLN